MSKPKRKCRWCNANPCMGWRECEEHRKPQSIKTAAMMCEARSSAALDGETQCAQTVRVKTQAEHELIEAALLFVRRHTDGAHCSFELDTHNCGSSEILIQSANSVRSERSKKT